MNSRAFPACFIFFCLLAGKVVAMRFSLRQLMLFSTLVAVLFAPFAYGTRHLKVHNLAFCTEIHSYGFYKPFATQEFRPGQVVQLYAEVENFTNEECSRGFRTALHSTYRIRDSQGRNVKEHDLGLSEEFCRNARRDYFIRYCFHMPASMDPGRYTLWLTIEDMPGQKFGQASIEFAVVYPSKQYSD